MTTARQVSVILSSMKSFLFGLAALSAPCVGTLAEANSVNKVIQLLTDLESKIKAEGVEAHRFERFDIWRGNGK